jgi:hypothetical protein
METLQNYQELVHAIATPVMILLYTLRLIILMRHKLMTDTSPDPKGDLVRGVGEAFLTLVMPWKMESTRKHWTKYVEFMLFHLGLVGSISLVYTVTWARSFVRQPVVSGIYVTFILIGLFVGVIRFIRRFTKPDLKIISVFDDYLSLFMLLAFNLTGAISLMDVLGWVSTGTAVIATYANFSIAGIFLIYAPFSKIHHYLYYPFARFFYGSDQSRKGILGAEVIHA